jgi:hypothetical protein
VITYLSSFDTATPSSVPVIGLHGPRNDLTFGWDVLVMALFSLVIYLFALRVRLPEEKVNRYVADLATEAEDRGG